MKLTKLSRTECHILRSPNQITVSVYLIHPLQRLPCLRGLDKKRGEQCQNPSDHQETGSAISAGLGFGRSHFRACIKNKPLIVLAILAGDDPPNRPQAGSYTHKVLIFERAVLTQPLILCMDTPDHMVGSSFLHVSSGTKTGA